MLKTFSLARRLIVALALAASLALSGCDDEDGEVGLFALNAATTSDFLPLDEYQYDDFNLPQGVLYWETRMNTALSVGLPVTLDYEVLFFYAQERLAGQIENNLGLLSDLVSNIGFANRCAPDYCPVYIAGLDLNGAPFTLTTQQELVQFFGDIDTPAELAYWLWSQQYDPISYEEVDGGWEATVEQGETCAARRRLELFVDNHGVVTVTDTQAVDDSDDCDTDTTFNDTDFNNPALNEPITGGTVAFDAPSLSDSTLNQPFINGSPLNQPIQNQTLQNQAGQDPFAFGSIEQPSSFLNESPLSRPGFGQSTFTGPSLDDSPLTQPAFDAPLFNESAFD